MGRKKVEIKKLEDLTEEELTTGSDLEKEEEKAEVAVEEKAEAPVKQAKKEQQKRWYIVHTYSGYENKVKSNLEKRIEYMNMSDKIFRIEVPQKTVTQIKGGKKQEKDEKIFPGYVLVEMIMDEDSWYVVRHTAGVTKFVGSAKKPIPAKDSEIKKVIQRSTSTTQKVEMDVKVGDKVRITSGPFAEFVGDITEVYPDKAKLRANVSIFGRETPVELEYKQIQKL
ncbi:transcription termination/antitermination protein NusG [bacterium]|nr:transcription termination/antitermination protein NusG [bacterium]